MKEQLETALANLINTTLSGAETTKDFLVAQTPEVIQQLLMWHGVKSLLIMIIPSLMFVVFFICAYCVSEKGILNFNESAPNRHGVFFIVFCFCTLVSLIVSTFYFNLTWLQIWIAPKVWLLEYASSLIK